MKRKIGNNIKYTIEEIKNYVCGLGFELLNKEYINSRQKLILKDKEGYLYTTTSLNIQRYMPEKFHKSNPYTIENIKLWLKIHNQSIELLSKIYLNTSTNLILKDSEGFLLSTPLSTLLTTIKRGGLPDRFNKSNPYIIQNIKLWLKLNKNQLELISKEYINAKDNLILNDNEGYMYSLNWDNLKQNNQRNGNAGKFYKTNPYTIQNIKLWCKLNNKSFELISNTYSGDKKKLIWQCYKEGCKEIFKMSWDNILNGQSCPYCRGLQVGLSNCLATKNPQLASEWHPILNGDLTPYDVTSGSDRSVWWVCKECGHEWEAIVAKRNSGRGCPECNKSHGEKECSRVFDLNNITYIPQKTFDNLVGVGNGLLSYDFYIPKYNLLIEYQGQQHEKYLPGFHQSKKDFKKQQEHDKRKKDYALSHQYNFLEIWYWDFENIERVLNDYLKN